MNKFGADVIELPESAPVTPPPEEPKKLKVTSPKIKKKSKSNPPKVKARNLIVFLETRLPKLDKSFKEMMDEYIASDSEDEDSLNTALYYEGQIQGLLDLVTHFGYEPAEFAPLIPNLLEHDLEVYRQTGYNRMFCEVPLSSQG